MNDLLRVQLYMSKLPHEYHNKVECVCLIQELPSGDIKVIRAKHVVVAMNYHDYYEDGGRRDHLLLYVAPGDKQAEFDLLQRFARRRKKYQWKWFEPHPDVIAAIQELQSQSSFVFSKPDTIDTWYARKQLLERSTS